VSLLSAWALAALLLAAPLVFLHLRRRRPPALDVASLLAWRGLPTTTPSGRGRFSRPPLPLLLALQLLALALLVFSLARPVDEGPRHSPQHVYVVDESLWMGATEAGTTRIEAARELLRERLARLPGNEEVAIVAAGVVPSVLFEGSPQGAAAALGGLRANPGGADLEAALRLAAGLRGRVGARLVLVRPPEEEAPPVRAPRAAFAQAVVGAAIDNQSVRWSYSCDRFEANPCEVLARVKNEGPAARRERLRIAVDGRPGAVRTLSVAAGASDYVGFPVRQGADVALRLEGRDALAADNSAFLSTPREGGERITLVGERDRALPLARALGSIPGVRLRLRTPASYRATDPGSSDLLVLDGFLPPGGLPDAPSLLLVDPPRLPGGRVLGTLRDSRLSGEEAGSSLLKRVDLSSLTIYRGGARRLALPTGLSAVAWSPEGPLIAAGSEGGQRLAVASFEPARSNLPQLASFPMLIANLVAWSQEWAPEQAMAGEPVLAQVAAGTSSLTLAGGGVKRQLPAPGSGALTFAVQRPGLYTLTQHGSGGLRSRTIAVGAGPFAPTAARAAIDLAAPPPAGESERGTWWPWLLRAALLVLLLEFLYARRREPRGPPRRRRWALALQGASLALLALALLASQTDDGPRPTTLVVDRSLSIGAGSSEAERAWLRASAGCGARCETIQFGGAPQLAAADRLLPTRVGGPLAGGETDLARALDLALARTPRGGRIVLLSDGFDTTGDSVSTSAETFSGTREAEMVEARGRARGVEIDTVPLRAEPADAGVTRVQAPAALHAGDPFSLEVTVRSTVAAAATLTLTRDGARIGSQQVRLAAADNPYLFSLRASAAGSHSYAVAVASDDDERPRDDALATTVRVGAEPSVLVAGAPGSAIAALLEADGSRVTEVAPAALPVSSSGYAGTDAVVLDDVSAPELGDERARALAAAVRREALGLFVLGGEDSFSLGRYYRSPLQAALPVRSLEPGSVKRKNLGVELILDRSGSMVDEVGGVPKIEMAQAAARGAVRYLARHSDRVGIVSFDIRPHLLVPVTRLGRPAAAREIEARIDGLRPDGGTDIYRGLAAGARQIEASDARSRHIILLSDGVSEPGSYRALLPKLAADRISVATVALGAEADTKLLKAIARETGGNFYLTENARELPRIFAKETRLSVRPVRLRGEIGVAAGASSPVVSSLLGQSLSPLGGNVVTSLKPGASAGLLGRDKGHPADPLLAQWQYGTGRVVTWTPGLAPPVAGAWAERPRLFQDAARWVERGVETPPLTPKVLPGGRQLEVETGARAGVAAGTAELLGSLRSATGKTIPLRFRVTAPQRYVAVVPKLREGVYAYAIAAGATAVEGQLAIPYPAEYRLGEPRATPLGPLAEASGGSVLGAADSATLEPGGEDLWWWLALAALLCFFAGAVLRLFYGSPSAAAPRTRRRSDSRTSLATLRSSEPTPRR
jgi:Ca-activated chloride channel family protein